MSMCDFSYDIKMKIIIFELNLKNIYKLKNYWTQENWKFYIIAYLTIANKKKLSIKLILIFNIPNFFQALFYSQSICH